LPSRQAEEQGNGRGRLDQAVGALIGLFEGKNIDKMVVKLT
jgi:NADPH-dependent curcumin reductase CurA